MMVLIPFDLRSLDSTADEATESSGSGLITTIVQLCTMYLSDPGPTSEAAGGCLARLLTRPDMEATHLAEFLEWSCCVLSQSVEAEVQFDPFAHC